MPEHCFRKINYNKPMIPNQCGKNHTALKKEKTDVCGLNPDLLNQNLQEWVMRLLKKLFEKVSQVQHLIEAA